MGTRSEIYVRNSWACVGLWKHWDGYPDYMVPMFKAFLRYAVKRWSSAPHWLTYPENMAALLISWYDRVSLARLRRMSKDYPVNVDIRPLFDVKGEKMICDAEYAWVLDLPEPITMERFGERPSALVYRIRGYELKDFNGLSPDEVRLLADGMEIDGPRCRKVVDERMIFSLETVALVKA